MKWLNIMHILVASLVMLTSVHAEEIMEAAEMGSIDYSEFPVLSAPDDLGFKILAPFIGDEPLYIRYADSDYRRIQTVPEGLSRTHYYLGGSPLSFYREVRNEEGELSYLPVGTCEFPVGAREIIVCLHKRGTGYVSLPIDMSLKAQPLGSVRFVNFTPANLVVLLGDERAAIGAGEEVTTAFATDKKTYFNFKVGAMYEDEAKMVYSKRHPFRGDMRILFIGYATSLPSGGGNPFRVVNHYDKGPEPRPVFAK